MSATISFKTKIKTMYNPDDSEAYRYVTVPVFKHCHCDMDAMRKHPRYGSFANSDLFLGILAKVRLGIVGKYGNHIKINELPDNISVDDSGFLAVVTITV